MGSVMEWMASERPTIIYGAGHQAGIVYDYCRLHGKTCVAIMTTKDKSRRGNLPDETIIPACFPDTYSGDKSTVDVIIAMGGTEEVRALLARHGYVNVYFSDNWLEGNLLLQSGKAMGYKFCNELSDMYMIVHGRIHKDEDRPIRICCNSNVKNFPATKFFDTPEETFDRFFGLRSRCISEYIINRNVTNSYYAQNFDCLSCVRLCNQDHLWYQSPVVRFVNLTPLPSPCQCKCIYCDKKTYSWEESIEVENAYKRMFETLEYGKKAGLIWKHATWHVSPGEITIHPFREEFMNLVYGENALFLTNGFLFDHDIAKNLRDNPNSRIDISLDSGTDKTWEKIKGFDNFKNVKMNLERYAENCCDSGYQIILKYIILPGINDNDEDYRGFVKFMKHINSKTFILSRDLRENNASLEKRMKILDAGARLLSYCRVNGMRVNYDKYFIDEQQEMERLSDDYLFNGIDDFLLA